MKSIIALLILSLSNNSVSTPVESTYNSKIARRSPLEVTNNYIHIRKVVNKASKISPRARLGPGQLALQANDAFVIADIQFGNQTIPMLIDSGSSDTWIVSKDHVCVNKEDESIIDLSECNVPDLLEAPPTGGLVKNTHFFTKYGDGSFVQGPMGLEDVTLGGLTVKNQQIGIANVISTGAGDSEGSYSGLMGIAYPLLTGAIDDTSEARVHYSPIIKSMMDQGLANSFSMALNRGENKGILAFGGVPPIDVTSEFVPTPIIKTDFDTDDEERATENSYYIGTIETLVYGPGDFLAARATSSNTSRFDYSDSFSVIVDSGAEVTTLPADLVAAIAEKFGPPAQVIEGSYLAKCDAVAPTVGVRFSKNTTEPTMWFHPSDLILQRTNDTIDGEYWCQSGIQPTDDPATVILGDTWMHSVVSVFHVGAEKMYFAQRAAY